MLMKWIPHQVLLPSSEHQSMPCLCELMTSDIVFRIEKRI